MRRREFIALLGGVVVYPHAPRAQETRKVPRIGLLYPGPPEAFPRPDALDRGLLQLGYAEARNVVIERAYGNWNPEGFTRLAAELVQRKDG
jgi:putative tryptophan/tyrosine transport system substrate-binding protein